MPDIVYPNITGWVAVPPYPRFLHENEPWAADDPFVEQNPQLFSTGPTTAPRRSVPADVEQATAAPGEKRNVTRTDAAFDEAEALRTALAAGGVKVDNRWSLDTLRTKKAELDSTDD